MIETLVIEYAGGELLRVPVHRIDVIERCSGHDGTYAVKSEHNAAAAKICRPVVSRIAKDMPDHYISDCPMAGKQIQQGMGEGAPAAESPFSLLRYAYGV